MRANRSVPAASVVPVLPYPDIETATAWLRDAFGFALRVRIAGHRAQLVYRDGAIIVTQGEPLPATVHVRVDDADAHHARASTAGARVVRPPADHPYGERQDTAEDPAGHRWTFSQTIADVDPADWGGELIAE